MHLRIPESSLNYAASFISLAVYILVRYPHSQSNALCTKNGCLALNCRRPHGPTPKKCIAHPKRIVGKETQKKTFCLDILKDMEGSLGHFPHFNILSIADIL